MNWYNILDYVNGQLFWKDGTPAGTPHSAGYVQVAYEKGLYLAHRIVWEMHNGPIPTGHIIDHDDRNKKNNYPQNLNLVTYTGNQKNRSKGKNNVSGVTGVTWDKAKKKWYASIKIAGKTTGLGRYTDMVDAIAARKNADTLHGFHANHGT